MASLAYKFSPTRTGKLALADRVAHAADQIISSSGEGEASRRDTAHPADVAAGTSISTELRIDFLDRSTRSSIPSQFAPAALNGHRRARSLHPDPAVPGR